MYRSQGVTLGGQGLGGVERITSMPVTPSFFRILRVPAYRGQLFTEKEAEPGQDKKVILSYALWQRLFGGRDDAIGKELRLNGVLYTIVGVMPRSFQFVDPDVVLWTVAAYTPEERSDERRHSNSWQQVARLAPGRSIEQAQSQIDAVNKANFDRFPQLQSILKNVGFHTITRPFQAELVEASQRTLYLLWGGVLCVLIIGCVNIANLVSIRASARVRELATRHALGASIERLSRQILTETLLIAVVGGVLGIALGWWALSAASVLGLDKLPRGAEISMNWQSLAFTMALVMLVGVLVGVLPVLALRRANLGQIVREEGRSGTASRRTRLVRRALVTSQVAFALILLVGAGLLLASFQRVLAIDPGFDATRVLTGNISLPAARYAKDPDLRAATTRLLERIRAVPGAVAVGFTSTLPVSGDHNDSVIFAEGYQMAPGESLISPSQVYISPGFFEAMGTKIKRGRAFDARDISDAPKVIIVDEQLARKFWPGQDPVGHRMYFPQSVEKLMEKPAADQMMTVVGVVENVRFDGLVDGPGFRTVGAYYIPLEQSPARSLALSVRTAQTPISATNGIRQAISEVDAELPFYNVRTMEQRIGESLVDRRTPMVLATGFAVVALFLAAIGIYGVLAYQVSQRTREIGVRMALGAATSSIFSMVLREGAAIVLAGAAIGLAGAYLLRQTLQSQLYEMQAMDPFVIATVGLVLVLVALVACLLPARKAARTDPVTALAVQ